MVAKRKSTKNNILSINIEIWTWGFNCYRTIYRFMVLFYLQFLLKLEPKAWVWFWLFSLGKTFILIFDTNWVYHIASNNIQKNMIEIHICESNQELQYCSDEKYNVVKMIIFFWSSIHKISFISKLQRNQRRESYTKYFG